MRKLFYLFLLFFFSAIHAQHFVIGKVTTEVDTKVSGVIVFNADTEEQVFTDKDGFFIIKVTPQQELRFIKRNFERVSHRVKPEDFSKPLNVSIQLMTRDIEEVEIAFKPTGNLKKDVKTLDKPRRVVELNENLAMNMKIAPIKSFPTNSMPSTIVMGPNYNAGQVSVLSTGSSGGVLGALINTVKRKVDPKTTPTYTETVEFYNRVKGIVDLKFFYNHGLDEYSFERLLVFADQQFQLTKNFRNNFDKNTIESYLKRALKEFLETKMASKNKQS